MTLLLAAAFLAASIRSGMAEVQFEPTTKSWRLTTGEVGLQLQHQTGSVCLGFLGMTNQAAWSAVSNPRADLSDRSETGGSMPGLTFSSLSLELKSHRIFSPKPGVEELQLSLEHRRRPLRLNVVYTTWADSGVITRQVQITNAGLASIEIDSCPSLVWDLPRGKYEVSYFWSVDGMNQRLKTQPLPDGAWEMATPQTAPWFALREKDSGLLFVAQMLEAGRISLRFDSTARVQERQESSPHVEMGARLGENGPITLQAGQSLTLPIVAFTATRGGLDDAAHSLQRYQRQFDQPNRAHPRNPVTFHGSTSAAATHSAVDRRESVALAAELGADTYAFDEGWEEVVDGSTNSAQVVAFSKTLANELRQHALKLAAAIDLSTVSPKSAVALAHPNWFLAAETRAPGLERLWLDFRQAEACDWAMSVLRRAIDDGGVRSIQLGPKHVTPILDLSSPQSRSSHARFILARSQWLENVARAYPQVLFADEFAEPIVNKTIGEPTGLLSVNDFAIESADLWRRTLLFPPERTGYNVAPPHAPVSPESAIQQLRLQLDLARNGSMELTGAVADWIPELRQLAKAQIISAKRLRETLVRSQVFHLTPPSRPGEHPAWMGLQYLTPDRHQCVVLAYRLGDDEETHTFDLHDLAKDGAYQIVQEGQPRALKGAAQLDYNGLKVSIEQAWGASVYELNWVPGQPVIHIDGQQLGRVFEGVGALSAGGSSRLLPDYPQSARSNILDLLFRPHYGAGFQHLKVEIGGDINSTAGTEPSHHRFQQETGTDRGYEWWLIQEARRRSPKLQLDALEWGTPAWIGEFYSQANADYLIEFLRQARLHHAVDIDYLGIRNEVRYEAGWIKLLRRTLDDTGFGNVQLVAPDEVNRWSMVPLMHNDPELAKAVAVVGVHYPQFKSSPEAQASGKRLWASEDGSWNSNWAGAKELAKTLNRNYIQGKMTKTIIWSLVAAYYDNLPNPSTGFIRANEPWSGHYQIQPILWAVAHTTQFVEPGWSYIAPGCGYLSMGGSIVSLRSTNQTDFSIIFETSNATRRQPVAFQVDGGLRAGPLHVWRSSENELFRQLPDLEGTNGLFSLWLEPGTICSLTSTEGQFKGQPPNPAAAPFPAQYIETFEGYEPGQLPRFFSDQGGAFEVALRSDKIGRCLRQVLSKKGIEWESHLTPNPETFLGNSNWRDYSVSVDALLEEEGSISLFGRVGKVPQSPGPPSAYWLNIAHTGYWELGVEKHPIASGKVGFETNRWHHLQLDFDRTTIQVRIDHQLVGSVSDQTYVCGMVGVGSGWHGAQFDNFSVQTDPRDGNLALGKWMSASSQADVDSSADLASDANAFSTRWTAALGKSSGQWLEVDFRAPTAFDTVVLKSGVEGVSQYSIQYWTGREWFNAAVGRQLGTAPTLLAFPRVTASKVRFLAQQAAVPPSLWEFEVFDHAGDAR